MIVTRLKKLIKLPPAEKWLLAEAYLLLPANAVALRVMSLKRWHGILANRARVERAKGCSTAEQAEARSTAARVVTWAARYSFFNANCLQRSLALWWLLRRQGIASELKVGARVSGQRCEAHAWVECAGEVLNDSEDVARRFPPFNGVLITSEAEIQ